MITFAAIWSGIGIGLAVAAIALIKLSAWDMRGRHIQDNPHRKSK